ncbi:MAG: membrane protein insertion efficiency factor YidD [Cellvibrionales bacterium TMED148]|nr:membrane protein insertion efficiency factor YidD [Porticoccaceae bacterium]RPG93812.1 MAG: membrane protein insertion efficiency factor YidD [Cellvibrionales bacterium TMED148]
MTNILIAFIRFYRFFISPIIGQNCRFYPTCSMYAIEALQAHGFVKGMYLTVCRIFKCHPGHMGGYDPVANEQNTREPQKASDLE